MLPGMPVTLVGEAGTVRGVKETEEEGRLSPAELTATSVMLYWVPLTRLLMVKGEEMAPTLTKDPPLRLYL